MRQKVIANKLCLSGILVKMKERFELGRSMKQLPNLLKFVKGVIESGLIQKLQELNHFYLMLKRIK